MHMLWEGLSNLCATTEKALSSFTISHKAGALF